MYGPGSVAHGTLTSVPLQSACGQVFRNGIRP